MTEQPKRRALVDESMRDILSQPLHSFNYYRSSLRLCLQKTQTCRNRASVEKRAEELFPRIDARELKGALPSSKNIFSTHTIYFEYVLLFN
jgi:hypothetical protein